MIFDLLVLASAGAQPATDLVGSDETGSSGPMIATQFRHIKLWFAAKLGNWRLAAYELDQLETGLAEATKRFPATPGPVATPKKVQKL